MAIDKVVDSSALDASLTAVADAVREKTGKTAAMTLAEMPTEIEGISGGGGDTSAEDGIVDRTISGEYTNSRVMKVGIYAFAYCSKLTTVNFPVATNIGNYAFYYCSKLTTVNFPVATNIGNSAFAECVELTTVDFPNVTSIDGAAFRGCTSLTTVDFPNVTSIGYGAFNVCSSLTTADFPNVTSIQNNGFYYCIALTALVIRNTSKVCTLNNTNAFTSTPIKSGTGYIYVPDALVDSYKSATNWSTYAAQIKPLSEYTGG